MALWKLACWNTHTYSTNTNTYTTTPCVLLWLAWVPTEFVIDGFCDWCCETGGAFKCANLHCLLQDNSPHWTCEYVRNCHHIITFSRVDNDDNIWCLQSTYSTTTTAWQQGWIQTVDCVQGLPYLRLVCNFKCKILVCPLRDIFFMIDVFSLQAFN